MALKKQAYKSMKDKLLRYTLRIDRIYFQKFRFIAQAEGRSANRKIEQYIKKHVNEYERAHGKIEVDDPDLFLEGDREERGTGTF